ncbi:MAG: phosphomannomutase/phosphoglucomutase [Anaerolineae bacterium]
MREVKVDPNIFRKYDVRGVAAGDDPQLSPGVARLIGKAYGTFMKRNLGAEKAYVGGDNRETTPALKAAVAEGIASTGMHVIDIGEVLTPTVYFAASSLGKNGGGVMVTGSHLTPEYNGIKMSKGSLSLHGDEITGALLGMVQRMDFETGSGSITQDRSIVDEHFETIKRKVTLGDRKLKVVVDAGNALAGVYIPPLYEALGLEVICLYCDPDPTFPNHLPNPESPDLVVDLQNTVVEHGADIGIGFDGDADRCGIIDNLGRHMSSDRTTALLAMDLLKRQPGATIVFDVKSSQALVDAVNAAGGNAIFWKTGHSLMKAKMAEVGAPLGGEVSGHIFVGEDYYGFDDAPLVSLKLLEILSNSDKTIAELYDALPHMWATPEVIMHAPDDEKFGIVEKIKERLGSRYDILDIDGVRARFDHGWGLVRVSNTHPAITMRFEAETRAQLLEYMRLVKEELKAFPAVDLTEFEKEFARVENAEA